MNQINKQLINDNFRLLRVLYNDKENRLKKDETSVYTIGENVIIDNFLYGLGYKNGSDLVSQTEFYKLHFLLKAHLNAGAKNSPLRRGNFNNFYKHLLEFRELYSDKSII